MKPTELRLLVSQIAAGLGVALDSPQFAARLLDRIGNLQHQAQHAQLLNHCLEKNRALHARNAELHARMLRLPQMATTDASCHPLFHVFNSCVRRALEEESSAPGAPCAFWHQSWVELAEHYGSGFLYAQAMQKLREAQLATAAESAARKRIEAINHIAKGLLYERQQGTVEDGP